MGLDPVTLKKLMAQRASARMVDQWGLYRAEEMFAQDGGVQGYRVIVRNDDTRSAAFNGGNFNGLGIILFESSGPKSQTGTTDQQGLTRWLSGHPAPGGEFLDDYPTDGRAEIEIKVAPKTWVNCANGQVNHELVVIVDGQVNGVNTEIPDGTGPTAEVPFPGKDPNQPAPASQG